MVKYIRARQISVEVQKRNVAYERKASQEERLLEQLSRFNQCWQAIRFNVPFYRELASDRSLPDSFRTWEEVVNLLPVMNRATIQQNRDRLVDKTKAPEWYRMTGGSTAQPIQLPAWKSEDRFTSPDTWLGRSWYGIQPTDRLFMIWGHSHVLGSGWRGRYNRFVREWKDRLLGYYRFSAYNMNVTNMQKAGEELCRYHPQYIIGYSVALDAFARANLDIADTLRSLNLKAAIGAAEGFPSSDSVDVIGKVIGAPVAMEYGSVETNLIAHTHPEGGYRVFWKTYFVECLEKSEGGGRVVRITSLYPRCFPLIRYELGDEIALAAQFSPLGIDRFERVMGRCNDFLVLRDGSRIHSELITHVVRSYNEISAYQVSQIGNSIRLTVTSSTDLPITVVQGIQNKLGKIHPELATVPIDRVGKLQQTTAGKTPIVVRRGLGIDGRQTQ